MSGSDWHKHPKFRLGFGLALAVFLASLVIGYGLLESANYERQSIANSSEYSRYTQGKVAEACVGIAQHERIKCLQDATDSQAEYEYDQADLVAQKQSALWAYIMAFAAITGMVLSAVGVFLVWTTFRETRSANDIARDAQRAWVTLRIKPKRIETFREDGLLFEIEYVAENIGDTVATHFDIEGAIFFQGQGEDIECVIERIDALIAIWKAERYVDAGSSLLPGDIESDSLHNIELPPCLQWWDQLFANSIVAQPIFLAAAFYRTTSDPHKFQLSWRTWRLTEFGEHGSPNSFIRRGVKPLTSDQIAAVPFRTSLMQEEYTATDDGPHLEG